MRAVHHCPQLAARDGGELGLAATGLDLPGQGGHVEFAGDHVVGEDFGQGGLVFRFKQGVDGPGGQGGEG
ncbi:hypothetical protein D9M71_745670 [compost metagenome]